MSRHQKNVNNEWINNSVEQRKRNETSSRSLLYSRPFHSERPNKSQPTTIKLIETYNELSALVGLCRLSAPT